MLKGGSKTIISPVKPVTLPSTLQAFDFGDVPTNQWADQLTMLTNTSSFLPLAFAAAKATPFFEVLPPTGIIAAGETMQLVVRYNPKAMGSHSGTVPLKISRPSGPVGAPTTGPAGPVLQELNIQVAGTSLRMGDKPGLVGGTDKLPKDFVKPNQYVSDDQVRGMAPIHSTIDSSFPCSWLACAVMALALRGYKYCQ